MPKYAFTPAERWAVFTAHGTSHGTRCWLCGEPVDFATMEVDHVLPEQLALHPQQLKAVLAVFGLPENFDINSFENWLPAHHHCNLQKRQHVFRPTPLIQLWLDRARQKSVLAKAVVIKSRSNKEISNAIGVLSTGDTALPQPVLDVIAAHYAAANSSPLIDRDESDAGTVARFETGLREGPSIAGYLPPAEVRLAPTLTITYDRAVQAFSDGPFKYWVHKPE